MKLIANYKFSDNVLDKDYQNIPLLISKCGQSNFEYIYPIQCSIGVMHNYAYFVTIMSGRSYTTMIFKAADLSSWWQYPLFSLCSRSGLDMDWSAIMSQFNM